MIATRAPAPSVPAARPLSQQASAEFNSLKHELKLDSWELAPSSWDSVQITYTVKGNEQQARSLLSSIELRQQEIH